MIKLFTIGFTKKTAEEFFNILKKNKVKKLIDIRLNVDTQLSGFAKGSDLPYFLKILNETDYEHCLEYAPTKELLTSYRNKEITWDEYEIKYNALIKDRNILSDIDINKFDNACFLCSEDTPEKCHRRLLSEYLNTNFPEQIEIIHL
jgi:uncharacterized protein (DUF488 family)